MHPLNPVTLQLEFDLSSVEISMPETDLILWLERVAKHSLDFSDEDLRNLRELSNHMPSYNVDILPEMQDIADKIKSIVDNKKWDPKLSNHLNNLIYRLVQLNRNRVNCK